MIKYLYPNIKQNRQYYKHPIGIGDAFSSKKIKNLEEQAEKLKFDILRCIYEGSMKQG